MDNQDKQQSNESSTSSNNIESPKVKNASRTTVVSISSNFTLNESNSKVNTTNPSELSKKENQSSTEELNNEINKYEGNNFFCYKLKLNEEMRKS